MCVGGGTGSINVTHTNHRAHDRSHAIGFRTCFGGGPARTLSNQDHPRLYILATSKSRKAGHRHGIGMVLRRDALLLGADGAAFNLLEVCYDEVCQEESLLWCLGGVRVRNHHAVDVHHGPRQGWAHFTERDGHVFDVLEVRQLPMASILH